MHLTLGNGVLWHGDAIQLMSSIPDESVDCIMTDPPYRTISGGKKPAKGFGWHVSVLKENNGRIFKYNDVAIPDYMRHFARLIKPGGHVYVMTNSLNLRAMLNVAAECGLSFHNLLGWEKNTATANRWYMKNVELCLMFYKKPAHPINNAGSKQFFRFNNPRNKIHPTEKPVELFQYWIENSTLEGDLVLDPFVGVGASVIAAERAGCRWIGIEIDPEYYYPACGRVWKELQG